MTMKVIEKLSDAQRLALAEKLVSLTDCTEASLFAQVHLHPQQTEPALDELEKAGYIHRDRVHHRVFAGPQIKKPPEVASYEARRDQMLRASPVGRKILGLDTGPSPDARAGGMSPARRAALLGASGLGRGMLRGEEAKKAGK